MNLCRILALPPVQTGLPTLSAHGDGSAAIELPGPEFLQGGYPLIPSRDDGSRWGPSRHAGAERGSEHGVQKDR